MQRSPHLPRFHSSLVYQKPTHLHSLEVLRNVCPYFEDECDFQIRQEKTDDSTTKATSACDISPFTASLERKNESVQTWNSKYESDLFMHDLNEVKDYGVETRDFIISRLESRPWSVSHSRRADPTSSDMNSSQITDCSPKSSVQLQNNTIHTSSRPCSPNTSRKSKLPVMKRSVSVDSSSRQTQVKDEKTKIFHPSGTKWFNDCQKLSFTKKMTSYSFREHNIKKQKCQCSCNNTIFGYSVK